LELRDEIDSAHLGGLVIIVMSGFIIGLKFQRFVCVKHAVVISVHARDSEFARCRPTWQ